MAICDSRRCWVAWIGLILCINAESREYCNEQTFRASCQNNEMVVMDKALYGRMSVGQCVKKDLGSLGCHVDVLKAMDSRCSGRQSCEVLVMDSVFTDTNPCYEELKLFLEADYSCQRVLESRNMCNKDRVVRLSEASNLLASRQLQSLSCFPAGQQWRLKLQALPGQQINVSLLDFEHSGSDMMYSCAYYGKVTDVHTRQGQRLCGGGKRLKAVMVSNSNMLELELNGQGEVPNFALQLEVLGCPEIRAPGNSWAERKGDSIKLGCHDSKQTWDLQCEGIHWRGSFGNCSAVPGRKIVASGSIDPQTTTESAFSSDVAIALIACVAILICVIVIAVGVNCWRKHTLDNHVLKLQQEALRQAQMQENPESEYMMPIYKPKNAAEEGEDALYDFCFMPGTSSANTNTRTNTNLQTLTPNNLLSAKTLPVRGDAKVNNTTVRFQTHSPNLLIEPDPNV